MKKTAVAIEEISKEGRKTMEGVNFLLKKAVDNAGDIEDLFTRLRDAGRNITGVIDMAVTGIKIPLIALISLILGLEAGLMHLLKREEKGGGEDVNQ
ncbi:MAG: hypothetical protein HZB21_06195 [Deltaproteobacteria bacterium]|nr:hypothetical protein [Deltaproteobacteria bacterium]MBI5810759.1 hypothetical protein [Deltaproteobacteria bacterium]